MNPFFLILLLALWWGGVALADGVSALLPLGSGSLHENGGEVVSVDDWSLSLPRAVLLAPHTDPQGDSAGVTYTKSVCRHCDWSLGTHLVFHEDLFPVDNRIQKVLAVGGVVSYEHDYHHWYLGGGALLFTPDDWRESDTGEYLVAGWRYVPGGQLQVVTEFLWWNEGEEENVSLAMALSWRF